MLVIVQASGTVTEVLDFADDSAETLLLINISPAIVVSDSKLTLLSIMRFIFAWPLLLMRIDSLYLTNGT